MTLDAFKGRVQLFASSKLMTRGVRVVLIMSFMAILSFGFAWGVTGANPIVLLEHSLTGYGMIQHQLIYDGYGTLINSKEIFRLGKPDTLASCLELLDQLYQSQEATVHSVDSNGTTIFTVRCPPASAP